MQMTSESAQRRDVAWWNENHLATALLLSLLIHALLYGAWRMAVRYGWDRAGFPAWMSKAASAVRPKEKASPNNVETKMDSRTQEPPVEEREPQLTFIEVDPMKAVTEAPKDAKYYSSVSTKAANPDPSNSANVPKVDGTQTVVPKILEPVPKTSLATPKIEEVVPPPPKPVPIIAANPKDPPRPLQPSPKAAGKTKDELTGNQPTPKGGKKFGDLAMAKPVPDGTENGQENPAGAPQPNSAWKRPRTLRQALAQSERSGSPGDKIKQPGGVLSQGDIGFAVKGTIFGDYDGRLIDAIRQCWYNDLDSLPSRNFPKGDVVIDFILHYNGKVTDVNISHDGVGNFYSFLCQGAIKKAAPFEPWPDEIRRAEGQDIREIRFTFYYY